jgi:hypothetical protein
MVAAGKSAVHNLSGHALSIYGTPGASVVVQVYAKPQPPAWG